MEDVFEKVIIAGHISGRGSINVLFFLIDFDVDPCELSNKKDVFVKTALSSQKDEQYL